MPSGRVLNSGGPPKIIWDAIVPSPLEDESDELDPQPLTPIVRAVATAASATSLVFMFSPGCFHLRCRGLEHERVVRQPPRRALRSVRLRGRPGVPRRSSPGRFGAGDR